MKKSKRSIQSPDSFFGRELGGETPVNAATALRLDQASLELLRRRPWDSLDETQVVFCPDLHTGEMCACSVMGALGEMFALMVYRDAASFHLFRDVYSDAISMEQFATLQRTVYVEYVPRSELSGADRELLRAIGHPWKTGVPAPVFRSRRPGYCQWYPNQEEAETLCGCLIAMAEFLDHYQLNRHIDYWRERDIYPGMAYDDEGGDGKPRFELRQVPAPEPPAEATVYPQLDERRIQRLLNQNLPVTGALEADCSYALIPIGPPDVRCCYPKLPVVLDANTRYAFHTTFSGDAESDAQLLAGALLEALEARKALPLEVRMTNAGLKRALSPLAQALGFGIKMVSDLPAVSNFRKEMVAFLARR
ncbi:MAG: hypothetical protein HY235_04100 [Acidobacteria bacterium]|nr:hypothetical protein [Acidobacteriota bacterium]